MEELSSRDIVTRALVLLRENYVFPELAEQVAVAIEARLAAGEYDDLDEGALAELLTGHLQQASDDKHLRVGLSGPPHPERRDEPVDRAARQRRMREIGRLDNFGIRRIEWLDIGTPYARSISPVTGTNWQGTGVIPDTPVPAGDAYGVAYGRALTHVLELGDVPPPLVDQARDALATLTQRTDS